MLTEQPTIPAGFALASRYQPSGRDIIGGDWYDVTVLPDGRVVVMVGDVAGHGMGVAAITAQMRHALRAYLVNEGSAATALHQLGTLIGALLPGKLATVVAAELEPSTGVVRVSSAGHLPILHLTPDGGRLVHEATGPALGVDVASPYVEATVQLAPGDALVLFSDGLVEQRGVHLLTSLEALRRRAEDGRARPGRAVRAAAGRRPGDPRRRHGAGDPAVLTAGHRSATTTGAGPAARVGRWTAPRSAKTPALSRNASRASSATRPRSSARTAARRAGPGTRP